MFDLLSIACKGNKGGSLIGAYTPPPSSSLKVPFAGRGPKFLDEIEVLNTETEGIHTALV